MHLRTVSDAKPHPKACNPAIISHSPEGTNFSFAIQVCGEYLGILFIGNGEGIESELLVWNWHNGAVELVRGIKYCTRRDCSYDRSLIVFIT